MRTVEQLRHDESVLSTEAVHLHVELVVAPPRMAAFLSTMDEVAPLMEREGWKLVGAWRVRIGRMHTIRVIWEVPDANAFLEDRAVLRSHPRFDEFRHVIDEAVIEEQVSVMTAISYGRAAQARAQSGARLNQ